MTKFDDDKTFFLMAKYVCVMNLIRNAGFIIATCDVFRTAGRTKFIFNISYLVDAKKEDGLILLRVVFLYTFLFT